MSRRRRYVNESKKKVREWVEEEGTWMGRRRRYVNESKKKRVPEWSALEEGREVKNGRYNIIFILKSNYYGLLFFGITYLNYLLRWLFLSFNLYIFFSRAIYLFIFSPNLITTFSFSVTTFIFFAQLHRWWPEYAEIYLEFRKKVAAGWC